MNYANNDITKRAEESPLWKELSEQNGKTLPYLLERYLLLENWKFIDRPPDTDGCRVDRYTIQFLHLLMADATTALLAQEERIRRLESRVNELAKHVCPAPEQPAELIMYK